MKCQESVISRKNSRIPVSLCIIEKKLVTCILYIRKCGEIGLSPIKFIPKKLNKKVKKRRSKDSSIVCIMSTTIKRSELYTKPKEVIQLQIPLLLPCYDFTPVTDPTLNNSLLTVRSLASSETNSHGVTGSVYKTRERIHRGMLIHDY